MAQRKPTPNAAFATMTDNELEAELQRRKVAQITPPTPLANPDFTGLVKSHQTQATVRRIQRWSVSALWL